MSQDYSVGQRLGDYEILGVLGAGGMGKVYKVRNTISDRIEAMKILLPDLAGQKELADRFLREIKVLASLDHPNIAALRTALTLDNQLVMIMEFVDGVTLASRLQHGPLPPNQAISYIDQVLAALSYAHKQNIIHRDIKPANMMLTSDGAVKLMDFGIARSATDRSLTMTGTTLGSLNYMPPEQVKGDPADNRSDLYSLGVSLYELVTGELPFQADSNYAMMAAHLQETPKPPIVLRPGIPKPLNEIILMALAKDPNERFQSADAFRGALKHVSAQGEETLPAISPRAYAPSAGANAGAATALFQDAPASQSPTPGYQRTQPLQTPAPPAAAAQAAVPAPPPPAAQTGHRGMYIALGAFIVLVVLFVAGLYVPRWAKTLGASKNRQNQQQAVPSDASGVNPSTPTAPADASPTPPSASALTPDVSSTGASPASSTPGAAASPADATAGQSPSSPPTPPDTSNAAPSTAPDISAASSGGSGANAAQPPKKSVSNRPPKRGARTAQSDAQSSASTDTVPSKQAQAEDAALAQEVEQKYDDIDSRTSAAEQSLDNLKRQQAASGYGLRGDIVSAEQRMKTDLSKAQAAIQNKDSKAAKKYLDMAEAELQTIEKFLGH
ncbi:MAG TPA: serine/threonine-protein kinase [Candidatus Methylomirabilis sp.]|nr:serine/threonine-protein kinase [Candidatus Methylomirabilis sp.]